jgi:hypothetical protein
MACARCPFFAMLATVRPELFSRQASPIFVAAGWRRLLFLCGDVEDLAPCFLLLVPGCVCLGQDKLCGCAGEGRTGKRRTRTVMGGRLLDNLIILFRLTRRRPTKSRTRSQY